MRIVLLCETFSKKMGYLQRSLSKHLAILGADVHVITMDLFPYYQTHDFAQTYRDFNHVKDLVPGTIESFEGYTLHVLPHRKVLGKMRMVGLQKKLRELRPDVVQTMANFGWIAIDAAMMKPILRFKLFTGNHFHASVFPLAQSSHRASFTERLRCMAGRTMPGYVVSLFSEKCYAITPDCAEIAVRFFGIPEAKVNVCPLGIDTGIFHPSTNEEDILRRAALRGKMGFRPTDIVCVYSGRFSEDKNPLLLAQAIARLQDKNFRALFLGNGVQAEAIRNLPGSVVHPFVPMEELGNYYRAADIGVWPTQESMSMLDAAACGLPIVVNHTLDAPERAEGNGVRYRLNDLDDLVRALLSLANPERRKQMGEAGSRKMRCEFSWHNIARRRLLDYEIAISSKQHLRKPATRGENEWA